MTTAERHRDEALLLLEVAARRYHELANIGAGPVAESFETCKDHSCREAAQFLIRVRSEMLKETNGQR